MSPRRLPVADEQRVIQDRHFEDRRDHDEIVRRGLLRAREEENARTPDAVVDVRAG